MKKSYDIAIIGGGASGLTAAITAKRNAPELSVAIFEKKECMGKKLSASGNGRCNLSNVRCEFIDQVIDFFSSVGISVRRDEEGRLYPYSEDAKSVTEILTACAAGEGVEIFVNSGIRKMEADPRGGFHLCVDRRISGLEFAGNQKCMKIHAEKVLIATGGKSYASMGTTGDGYIMARRMGHKVTRLIPGLTPIQVCEDLKDLKGIRSKAQATLYRDNATIFREKGEIQFKADSISGICIMNMSRYIKAESGRMENGKIEANEMGADEMDAGKSLEDTFSQYSVAINLMPDFETEEIIKMLKSRFTIKNLCALDSMKTLIKEPLARRILLQSGVEPDEDNRRISLDDDTLMKIAHNLCTMKFKVKGLKGWNEAQITVGGVPAGEVDCETMESKLIEGLFFSGEVLDYDGPCGGYNLHNAWRTGLIAGKGMAVTCIESTR